MNIKIPPLTGRKKRPEQRKSHGRRKSDVWPALTRVLTNLAAFLSVITGILLYWLDGMRTADRAAVSQSVAQKIEIENLRRQLEEAKAKVEEKK